jgi:hypothetical protein
MFWKPPNNSDHLNLATLGFDNFFGLNAGSLDPNCQGYTNGTLAEQLDSGIIFFDNTGLGENLGIYDGIRRESRQISNVDNGPRLFEDVGKTTFGETSDEGHLAAFKGRADFGSGTGSLSFMAPTCGLAMPRAGSPAHTFPFMLRPWRGLQFI